MSSGGDFTKIASLAAAIIKLSKEIGVKSGNSLTFLAVKNIIKSYERENQRYYIKSVLSVHGRHLDH